MENEPAFNYKYDGVERQMRRDNTRLYTFFGRLALYNHVFTTFDREADDEPKEDQRGLYIYQATLPAQYTRLEEFIVENSFTQYLNLPEVSEMDQASLHRVLASDLHNTNTIPEDWITNGES